VHGSLDHSIWRLGVHHIENRVDHFVAAGPQDARAEDPVRFRVDYDLHESLRLALLDRAPDTGHRTVAQQCGTAQLLDLIHGHASAAERRVNIQIVCGYPVADAPGVVVQKICGYDFEVVVGRVGETAFAIAITDGPDAFDVGS